MWRSMWHRTGESGSQKDDFEDVHTAEDYNEHRTNQMKGTRRKGLSQRRIQYIERILMCSKNEDK